MLFRSHTHTHHNDFETEKFECCYPGREMAARERKPVQRDGFVVGSDYERATRAEPTKRKQVFAFSSIIGEKLEVGTRFLLVDWGPQHGNERTYEAEESFATSKYVLCSLSFPPLTSISLPDKGARKALKDWEFFSERYSVEPGDEPGAGPPSYTGGVADGR